MVVTTEPDVAVAAGAFPGAVSLSMEVGGRGETGLYGEPLPSAPELGWGDAAGIPFAVGV